MKNIIVIGGGMAGLSAAIYLAEKNFQVMLIENAPQLGGRAKSFFDAGFNSYLDNGQHLLINGYHNTLELINKSNAKDNFIFQKVFTINFRDKKSEEWKLEIASPIKTIFSFLKFRNLNFIEKALLLNFFLRLNSLGDEFNNDISALNYLRRLNQSEKLINNFWKLLIESALNTPINKSSSRIFIFTLKKMFEDKSNGNLIIPKNSLYESLIIPLEKYLVEKGVTLIKACGVEKILIDKNNVTEVIIKNGRNYKADYYILAVHPSIINKLIPHFYINLEYQTIINVHLKISSNKLKNKFFALWGSIIHWAFFHENHLTLVKSSADELLKFSNEQILEIFIEELKYFFPEIRDNLLHIKDQKLNYRVIKEKRSTFLSDLNSNKNRPSFKTNIENLFLAGDYVSTGYPSTIESAVISGKLVAEEISNSFKI